MKFYSEQLNKFYDTAAEVLKAEEEHSKKLAAEKAKKEELANARKTRAEEVEKAFKVAADAYDKANQLLADFCKDYGAYYKTYKEGEKVPSLFDWFNSWLDWKL